MQRKGEAITTPEANCHHRWLRGEGVRELCRESEPLHSRLGTWEACPARPSASLSLSFASWGGNNEGPEIRAALLTDRLLVIDRLGGLSQSHLIFSLDQQLQLLQGLAQLFLVVLAGGIVSPLRLQLRHLQGEAPSELQEFPGSSSPTAVLCHVLASLETHLSLQQLPLGAGRKKFLLLCLDHAQKHFVAKKPSLERLSVLSPGVLHFSTAELADTKHLSLQPKDPAPFTPLGRDFPGKGSCCSSAAELEGFAQAYSPALKHSARWLGLFMRRIHF